MGWILTLIATLAHISFPHANQRFVELLRFPSWFSLKICVPVSFVADSIVQVAQSIAPMKQLASNEAISKQ